MVVAEWAAVPEVARAGAATAADWVGARVVEATAEAVTAAETVEAGLEEDLPICT